MVSLKSRIGLLGGLALAVVILGEIPSESQNSADVPKTDHGAATMAYQQQLLDKLLPEFDTTKVPDGFDPVIWDAFIPESNGMTASRIALGRKLYFEKRLSDDGTVSCATCHDVTRGFTDQLPTSEGINGQKGRRNAPTTLNVALLQTLFLDGRSPTLDHQARLPIVNPIEMGFSTGEESAAAIKDDAEYQRLFQEAYGRGVNYEDIGNAIGAFERTLVFLDSPFRRFLLGEETAISADVREGWRLFNEKGRCAACHQMSLSNPLGTDNRFHNVGVSARHQDFESLAKQGVQALKDDPSERKLEELALASDMSELGRFMVTTNRSDIGSFRTSMILNVGITPPYMHDGSLPTLWDVMDHYNKGGEANPFLDGGMEPLALSEQEIDQLVAFLFSLTDYRFAGENERQMRAQKAAADKVRAFKDDELAFRQKLAFEDRISK